MNVLRLAFDKYKIFMVACVKRPHTSFCVLYITIKKKENKDVIRLLCTIQETHFFFSYNIAFNFTSKNSIVITHLWTQQSKFNQLKHKKFNQFVNNPKAQEIKMEEMMMKLIISQINLKTQELRRKKWWWNLIISQIKINLRIWTTLQ